MKCIHNKMTSEWPWPQYPVMIKRYTNQRILYFTLKPFFRIKLQVFQRVVAVIIIVPFYMHLSATIMITAQHMQVSSENTVTESSAAIGEHTCCWLGFMQKADGSTFISSPPRGLLHAKSENITPQIPKLLHCTEWHYLNISTANSLLYISHNSHWHMLHYGGVHCNATLWRQNMIVA